MRRLWTSKLALARPALFLSFRIFVALYAIVVSAIDKAISTEQSHRYIAYLTVQGVWLTVCYLTCNALVNVCVWRWPLLSVVVLVSLW